MPEPTRSTQVGTLLAPVAARSESSWYLFYARTNSFKASRYSSGVSSSSFCIVSYGSVIKAPFLATMRPIGQVIDMSFSVLRSDSQISYVLCYELVVILSKLTCWSLTLNALDLDCCRKTVSILLVCYIQYSSQLVVVIMGCKITVFDVAVGSNYSLQSCHMYDLLQVLICWSA